MTTEMKVDQMKLESGLVLDLQPVTFLIIQSLIVDLGGLAMIENPQQLADLEVTESLKYTEAFNNLLMYCSGWGVKNDPPNKLSPELELIAGDKLNDVHHKRAYWVRFQLTSAEAGELTARIIALSK